MADKTIAEMEQNLATIDAQMTMLREEKDAKIVALKELQRQRDAIMEPLERARAAARTAPAQVIGL